MISILVACNDVEQRANVDDQAVEGTLLLGSAGTVSGVRDWSWDTSLDTDVEKDGRSGVNVTYNAAWAGLSLKLDGAHDTTRSEGIAITLKGSGQKLLLWSGDEPLSAVNLTAASRLETVYIPWSDLGSPNAVSRITLQEDGGSAQTAFFIDNIYLYEGSASSPAPDPTSPVPTDPSTESYEGNLNLIQAASVRNRNHDDSPYRATPQADLPLDPATSPLFGPREEYVENGETGSVFKNAGTFRIMCEFSHFAYDDPLVYPGQPGASHLHMYFGNTDVNAYSTYDTLKDSGSSTCNGQELNRTGYWVPALFDAEGNVRIPMNVLIYYKGENLANGNSVVYPPGAAMIAKDDKQANAVPTDRGGALGMSSRADVNFACTDASGAVITLSGSTIPDCSQSSDDKHYRLLKMQVKFPMCWNRQDASDPDNWSLPRDTNWYSGDCEERITTPHLEYIIFYRVELDESMAGWYLASDVDPHTRQVSTEPGASTHADWWGGWHPDINEQWIDNCVNYKSDELHGCGTGYLSNLGPDPSNPYPGPALKFRPDYTGPLKVAAGILYRELCPQGGELTSATVAAYCTPADMEHMNH